MDPAAGTPVPEDAAQVPVLVRVYNKYVVDMLLSLKSQSPCLKAALKAHHKAIDPTSLAYIAGAVRTLSRPAKDALLAGAPGMLEDEAVLAFEAVPHVPLSVLLRDPEFKTSREAVRSYVYVFAVLAATHEGAEEGAASGPLATAVLQALAKVQGGDAIDEVLEGIMDDDVSGLLGKLAQATDSGGGGDDDEDGASQASGMDDVMRALENSKIGELAKEITGELDMSSLQSADPSELFNLANITDQSSVLGNIVSKVGSKIQHKLQHGEIRHDELLAEAMTMLKAFNGGGGGGKKGGKGGKGSPASTLAGLVNNPMVGEMLKAMGGGGGGAGGGLGGLSDLLGGLGGLGGGMGGGKGRASLNVAAMKNASARDRLRQTFEQKQQQKAMKDAPL